MIHVESENAFEQLIESFAARTPLPAGGAAGVTAIAMGLGLGLKVLAISCPDGEASTEQLQLRELLDRLKSEFRVDCAAFDRLLATLREPKTEAGHAERVRLAWRAAAAKPVGVAVMAREAVALLSSCRHLAKASVRADLEAARDLARTGAKIAGRNARENATRLDPDVARQVLAPLDRGDGIGAVD
ncbi:MAG: cyclodeaminase/cyclohydrolase family protein [Planctomycetes bacterium]|nr:cyclodeaminase/cyclohydrolase family protein [Planctomycetota bacterium]